MASQRKAKLLYLDLARRVVCSEMAGDVPRCPGTLRDAETCARRRAPGQRVHAMAGKPCEHRQLFEGLALQAMSM